MTTSEMISIIRTATGKENLMDGYAELLKKYEAAQARIAELERTIDAKDAEIATAQLVIEDNAKEVYCLEAQVENLEAEVEEMKTLITMKDYERMDLEEKVAELEAQNTKLMGRLQREEEESTITIANIEEDNAMLNDKTMELMAEINRLQWENRGLRADLEGTERRVQEVERLNLELSEELDAAVVRENELKTQVEELGALNVELVSDLENTEVKVWDLQAQIEVLESEADAVNRVCSAIAAKDKNLERVDVLEGELEASQQAVEYLKKVRDEMAAEMEALRKENQNLTKRLIDIAFIANGGEYDSIDDGADTLPF